MSAEQATGIIIGYTMVVVVFTLMMVHLYSVQSYWGMTGMVLCAGWLIAIFIGIVSEGE